MRCQNLAVPWKSFYRSSSVPGKAARLESHPDSTNSFRKMKCRQLTGCTSPKTTIVFTLAELSSQQKSGTHWTDVFVSILEDRLLAARISPSCRADAEAARDDINRLGAGTRARVTNQISSPHMRFYLGDIFGRPGGIL